MNTRCYFTGLLVVFLSAAAAGSAPETELSYNNTRLRADGLVREIFFRDMNGDQRPDIVLQKDSDILIFRQRENRTFSDTPDESMRLKDNTFLWTACPLQDSRPMSIVTLTSSGVSLYSIRDGKFHPEPEELLAAPNLFEGKASAPPLFSDFLPDLNTDGRRDLILYRKNELMLFLQTAEGRFRIHQKLGVPMEAERSDPIWASRKISDNISVPPLFIGDVNGDAKRDIAYYHQESVGLYLQDTDGRFQEKQYSLVEKKSKRKHTLLNFEIPPIMADINRDGILDIVLPFPSKGNVNIYYTRAGRTDFRLPDDIKKTDGWLVGTWLKDLNRDNKQDLIVAGVERFGVIGGLQIFLTQKIPLNLMLYPYRSDGLSREAASRLTFSIPFIINLTSENVSVNTTFLPNFDGDYNNDGLRDLLIKGEDNTLKIYTGHPETVFEDRPSASIKITPPADTAVTETFVSDLNNDGKSDILLRHSYWKDERQVHVLELLLSR